MYRGTANLSLSQRIALLLNMCILLLLAGAYLGRLISPASCWPLAFPALVYPVLLAITVAFIPYWLVSRKWWALLNVTVVLLNIDSLRATIQLKGPQETMESAGSFKVMTFNVRLFDYFHWAEDRETRSRSFEFIYDQQPNILCIQEFYVHGNDRFRTMDTLRIQNSIKHAHIEPYRDDGRSDRIWGMATFSSYPIVNKGVIAFESTYGNRCLYSDLKIGNDTIRVYNLHLQSVRIGDDQYLFIDRIMMNKSMKDVPVRKLVGDLTLLVKRMVYAFIERGKQAEKVKRHMETSPYPVLLCGDFNDTPSSYAYHVLAKGMHDTFVAHGSGLGNTYVRIPFFRIDYILYGTQFESLSHHVHDDQVLSDHFALSARLRVKGPTSEPASN